MKILNLHGLYGDADNHMFTILNNMNAHEVISPKIDYIATKPQELFHNLYKTYLIDKSIDLITGTSLGGYFSQALGRIYDIPYLVVNPCLDPIYYIPKLTLDEFGDDHTFDIAVLSGRCELANNQSSRMVGYYILGDSDEVINPQKTFQNIISTCKDFATKIVWVNGGLHSASSVQQYEDEIKNGVNLIENLTNTAEN